MEDIKSPELLGELAPRCSVSVSSLAELIDGSHVRRRAVCLQACPATPSRCFSLPRVQNHRCLDLLRACSLALPVAARHITDELMQLQDAHDHDNVSTSDLKSKTGAPRCDHYLAASHSDRPSVICRWWFEEEGRCSCRRCQQGGREGAASRVGDVAAALGGDLDQDLAAGLGLQAGRQGRGRPGAAGAEPALPLHAARVHALHVAAQEVGRLFLALAHRLLTLVLNVLVLQRHGGPGSAEAGA